MPITTTAKAKTKGAKNNPFVKARVKNLPANFLDCRDPGLRHKWDKTADFHVIKMATTGKKIEALGRTETCERCGSVKQERFIVGQNGIEKVGHSYDYPEGYLLPGIPRGVMPSTVIYQENYRRANEAAALQAAGGDADIAGITARARSQR